MKRSKDTKHVIGIDEAGRGPLAGPVTVAVFGAEKRIVKWLLKNIFQNKLRDSKKLSPKQRYTIYRKLLSLKKESKIYFLVSHISNKIIDKKGISWAIRLGIKKCLSDLTPRFASPSPRLRRGETYTPELKILLDGSLKAPKEYKNQETIVGGDSKNIFIACASIVAKISRDRLMCRLAKKYPNYNFEIHKGYGTKLHYEKIKKYGLSEIHRKSFCKNI